MSEAPRKLAALAMLLGALAMLAVEAVVRVTRGEREANDER